MKYNLEELIRSAAARETLSESERARMRFVVREYLAFKPIRAQAERPPSVSFLQRMRDRFARSQRAAAAALLILALSGSGVAYAAEGALPGDVLYPVKVEVTEPARTLFAASPSAEASWQMTLAARRIDEAALLAKRGSLATTTEERLAARFTQSAAAARAALSQESTTSPDSVRVFATAFATRLAAYTTVLAHVDDGASGLSAAVQEQEDAARAFSKAPATIPEARAAGTASAIARIGTNANRALQEAADLIGENSAALSATSSQSAKSELARASDLAAQGRALLGRGDRTGALAAFSDSLSATARLDVLTHASATLRVDLFASADAHAGQEGGRGPRPGRVRGSSAHHDATSSIEPGSLPPPPRPQNAHPTAPSSAGISATSTLRTSDDESTTSPAAQSAPSRPSLDFQATTTAADATSTSENAARSDLVPSATPTLPLGL